MYTEGGAHQLGTLPMSAWTLVTELLFAGPFADEAIQRAVVALLPVGPWAQLLQRSLTDSVVAATLYMQQIYGTGLVHLQCYQLHSDAAAQHDLVPTTQVGWSFFLLEKASAASSSSALSDPRLQRETDAKSPQVAVQIYLFHD